MAIMAAPWAMAWAEEAQALEVANTGPRISKAMAAALTPETIDAIVALIPDGWLTDETAGDGPRYREAYRRSLQRRLESPRRFVEEAVRVR